MSMHNIIAHMTFERYREVAPDAYSVAILLLLLLLLLSFEIKGFGILKVHPVNVVRKSWEPTTNSTRLLNVKE
jgi:hypothetical protein